MSRAEHYHCGIDRDEDGRIVTILITADDLEGDQRIIRIDGARAAHAAVPLQEVFRAAGLRGRQWTAREGFDVPAALGAHAELLLRAVKPLRRVDRILSVSEGIAGMSAEEAGYWHAQTYRRHGLKALRILLDGGR